MELYTNEIKPEKALLISVDTGHFDAEISLRELRELTETAGAEVVGTVIQKRPNPDTASCVGEGKLEEICQFCEANEVDLLIFDLELSPIQLRNIEKITDLRVIDRTMLILDIFALRARSKEGCLQVELAQLKYMLPRLTGRGVALSRQGGGIGTRGPGESKLESDRRHIHRRIDALRAQLDNVQQHREQLRKRRQKDGTVTVAIVGYTNAGKSTLMNTLTQAGVLAENKLFATLDPTARALKLPDGRTVMLIDTVGLIQRLPHHLVDAFKSTLEEAVEADIILNVCDASSEEAFLHLQVTETLLAELGCHDKPILRVMNKCDLLEEGASTAWMEGSVRISAKSGAGLPHLLESIAQNLPAKVTVTFLFPFDKGNLAAQVRREEQTLQEEYTAQGLKMTALVDVLTRQKLEEYILSEEPDLFSSTSNRKVRRYDE